MIRYTITTEGEQYRVTAHFPWESQPCGLFKTVEQAHKSLSSLEPSSDRKFPEAIAEYGK